MSTLLAGFGLGLSLILAIGAQNAFVLRQGVKRQYLWMVCAICACSDALLITAGVYGIGELIQSSPTLLALAKYGGAAFLFVYGFISFRAALFQRHRLLAAADTNQPRWQIALACLGFTWLNPHVYLDTLVLLGTISTQFAPEESLFAVGAVAASFIFFFCLGFGARALSPLFSRPKAWQTLELIIAVVMWSMAIGLLL